MRQRALTTLLPAGLALALVGPARAQQPPAQAPGAEAPASPPEATGTEAAVDPAAAPAPDTLERPPLDEEMEGSGFTYESEGRRDPFVSLQAPVAANRGATRPRGMPGFLIQEVALRGIVRTAGGGTGIASEAGYIAIFQGPDPTQSYFVRTGQRLYDGVITAVDATSVTFRQDVTDPLSPVKSREVRKSLYASEEAR